MKKLALLLLFLFMGQIGNSQETSTIPQAVKLDESESDEVFYTPENVDVKLEFPGGISAFYKFIANNYTQPESQSFRGGKIVVDFFIEKDGTLNLIKVEGIGFGTKEETTRVFLKSPKWKPAILNGKPVKCSYRFPILLQGN